MISWEIPRFSENVEGQMPRFGQNLKGASIFCQNSIYLKVLMSPKNTEPCHILQCSILWDVICRFDQTLKGRPDLAKC